MPTLASGYSFEIDTATAGQVNLVTVVPEPSAIALAGIGIAAAGYAAWKRRLRVG
ncbi:MAG: PEP-CTERM sorting domain-containing protein [Lentisphaerota bacterium]